MQLVLQPCGDSDAIEHYVDTIENPVSLERVLPFLPQSEHQRLRNTFGDSVAVWGVTPGKTGGNAKKWARMELGDTAMLYRDKRFFFKGEVAASAFAPDPIGRKALRPMLYLRSRAAGGPPSHRTHSQAPLLRAIAEAR